MGRTQISIMAAIAAFALVACDVKFGDRDGSDTAPSPTSSSPAPASEKETSSRLADAQKIHDRILTLDTHVDIPLNYMTYERDPGGLTEAQVDLPKMRMGGLDAAFFIVYIPQGELSAAGFAQGAAIAETRFAAIHNFTRAYPKQITLAKTASDVRRAVRDGRKAALIGMENSYPLGADLSKLPIWRDRGVRYVGLTHFGHNQFGDSSNPNPDRDNGPRHGGLSDLGKDLVAALNDAGIMVDVSHAGKATMMQATALSRAPIIASHSGVKAIGDSPRNLDDEQLRALAKNGGVAQMVALGAYVKPYSTQKRSALEILERTYNLQSRADYDALEPSVKAAYDAESAAIDAQEPDASVADFVDHIDHAVKIAGIDHVGIASDFDGGGGITGWQDASETLNVTRELLARGYSESDIAKIWSGNMLRVMEAVERAAR